MNPQATKPAPSPGELQQEPTLPEQMQANLEADMRAAGFTVSADESESTEYTVTFPRDQDPVGQVELTVAMPILARDQAFRALLRGAFDPPKADAMLALMSAGRLDGDLGAELDDFLVDTIENDSEIEWEGLIDGEYPVQIQNLHGVYHVWAMEFGRTGYFLDVESARSYIDYNWDTIAEG